MGFGLERFPNSQDPHSRMRLYELQDDDDQDDDDQDADDQVDGPAVHALTSLFAPTSPHSIPIVG